MKVKLRIVRKVKDNSEIDDLDFLIRSIRDHGQVTPVLLNHDYEIIAGERRVRACEALGYEYIDAILVKG